MDLVDIEYSPHRPSNQSKIIETILFSVANVTFLAASIALNDVVTKAAGKYSTHLTVFGRQVLVQAKTDDDGRQMIDYVCDFYMLYW